MFKKLNTMLSALALMIGLLSPVVMPATPAYASASTQAACKGISLAGQSCGGNTANNQVNTIFATIVNILSVIVGAVAVIMIIVAGFKYITSNGDSNNISSAKNTLIYAVIGMFIVVFAQAITRFVFAVSN